jgi:hypothetical protein
MTEQLQQQLILAASKMKATAIDSDVFKALVTEEIDASDSEAIQQTAKKIVEQHPNLFKFEKGWGELDDDAFQRREEAFRASLRKSHTVGPNPFKELDAALLPPDSEELRALERVLSGHGGSYDRSLLSAALAKQKALFKGDAA